MLTHQNLLELYKNTGLVTVEQLLADFKDYIIGSSLTIVYQEHSLILTSSDANEFATVTVPTNSRHKIFSTYNVKRQSLKVNIKTGEVLEPDIEALETKFNPLASKAEAHKAECRFGLSGTNEELNRTLLNLLSDAQNAIFNTLPENKLDSYRLITKLFGPEEYRKYYITGDAHAHDVIVK